MYLKPFNFPKHIHLSAKKGNLQSKDLSFFSLNPRDCTIPYLRRRFCCFEGRVRFPVHLSPAFDFQQSRLYTGYLGVVSALTSIFSGARVVRSSLILRRTEDVELCRLKAAALPISSFSPEAVP
ncbi:Uncharacterized protein Rs2_45607 [Raphanus sativus]|nr:Uncharacterized protein Rs2_45607 [Raphanus sativus]